MAVSDNVEKERSRSEYLIMLEAFKKMIYLSDNEDDVWLYLENIIEIRYESLMYRVLDGMNLSFSDAKELLKRSDSYLSDREKGERDILIAAYDNLIDFAIAEELQMLLALPDIPEDDDLDDIEEYEDVFYKYNSTYAHQENQDVLFAAGMAYWWLGTPNDRMITFMTQRDERVRDTHAILDGESYPKSQFPQELIPPIEHGCRCYLVDEGFSVQASSDRKAVFLPIINPIFKESLAKNGRIYTDEHPYFNYPLKYKKRVKEIKIRMQSKYYGD